MTNDELPEGLRVSRRRSRGTIAQIASSKITQPVVVTVLLGIATLYFNHKTEVAKDRASEAKTTATAADVKTDKGYETLAPLVVKLQEQVNVLTLQVELLREFAMVQNPRALLGSRPTKPQVAAASAAQDAIEKIVEAPTLPEVKAVAPPATLGE
jgi:hypothetical protein